MKLSEMPGSLKKLRRTPWKFQQTFHTPLNNLRAFVATILAANEATRAGCILIKHVVFRPKHLLALLASHSIAPQHLEGLSVAAGSRHETEELLHAALSDWTDFFFVPDPKPYVIYADHDEYATFYANSKSNLNRITKALENQGFKMIPNYQREF